MSYAIGTEITQNALSAEATSLSDFAPRQVETARTASGSSKTLWVGRILSGLAVLFLTFDGAIKFYLSSLPNMDEKLLLGFSMSVMPKLGAVLLACTALYTIRRTSALGAVLLTGYLGGAIAAHVRMGGPVFSIIFPLMVAAVLWSGLFLRDARLRAFLPWRNAA